MDNKEASIHEALAEAAYDAMYEATPAMGKHHYENACGNLAKAIEAARRAGVEIEVVRLTARLDHIMSVFDHQFRGIG